MNLKQLEAFVQVSESGSFSKAAKELFLTQPTISAHISSLEKELNVRFYMDSDDGKHFITIAASTIPAQYLLPKVLMCYRERYPKEQIKIMETDSSEVVTQVVDHMVDVGFTGTVLEKKHCKYIPFYKDELAVIAPDTPEYRILKEQNRDDIDWIKRKPLILREEGSGIVASIANQETIKKSVKQGMGITVLSRLAAEDEDGLLIFPIPGADEGRDINLVYNKNYQMTRSADRFIRIVKEVYDIE